MDAGVDAGLWGDAGVIETSAVTTCSGRMAASASGVFVAGCSQGNSCGGDGDGGRDVWANVNR